MPATPNEERLQEVLDEAGRLAAHSGVPHTSAHLLLALLSLENEARLLLSERGLTAARIAEVLETLGEETEAPEMLSAVRDRCRVMAQSCGSPRVSTLHLVLALASVREALAFRIMSAAGLDLASLRSVALALITGGPARNLEPREPALETVTRPAAQQDTQGARQSTPAVIASTLPPEAAPGILPVPSPSTSVPPARRRPPRLDPRVTRGGEEEELEPESPHALDEEKYPTLVALGRNLSEAAQRGELEPLVGRRALVERILDTLGKRRANNPCLIGEPGVGKTTIVEGLAYLQVHEPDTVPFLKDRHLIALNMGGLVSGTGLRGAFSERMAALRGEVETAEGKIIVFLDEIHTLVGAGAVGDGALDAVGELSAAMARGTFPCIGATTTENYKKYIEETPALQRRLQTVLVPEPSLAETEEILAGVVPAYARHHSVSFAPEAIDAAVRLSSRYIADRFLPDKALSLLDLAGSRARRRRKEAVGRADVAELVAETTSIPLDRLLMTDTDRFLRMEDFLKGRIIGHRNVVKRVCQVIRRNYAGFSSNRPIGSFLFLGPTGVGKTELVKVLADFLFQSREALCRFDMSEFMEPHSVARFIGSPPGYVGHEEGGQLTETVRRRPYQIVLLDEIEKAHRDVQQILLQILDDGRLTDGRGRTVDFSNTVVVMTSNLGSAHYDRRRGPNGFASASATEEEGAGGPDWERITEEVLTTARRAFPIELWNRIEERQVFEPLSRAQILEVARLLVQESSARLQAEKQIEFSATPAALDYLVDHGGFDPTLGARPMRTTIQRLIEGPVAEQILLQQANPGDKLRVDLDAEGKLVVERATGST